MLGSAERGKVRLISREIIFQEFHATYMTMIPERYRQTDGQKTCHGNTRSAVINEYADDDDDDDE